MAVNHPPGFDPLRFVARRSLRAPLSPEERHRRIAEGAYARAAARGFVPGHEVEDWLAAEIEVDLQVRGPRAI